MVYLDDRKSKEESHHQDKETYHDVTSLILDVERKLNPYPELSEPTYEDEVDEPPQRLEEVERTVVLAMTGLFGAVAIYAMTTGDRPLLRTLLTIAMLLILRLLGRRKGRPRQKGRNHGTRSKAGPNT
jgi:hypothetical protein